MRWDRDGARHIVMRLGLAFVVGWFGIQELRSPSEWAVFVPSFVGHISPVAVNDLVLVHGFLLLLACCSIVAGLLYLPGCLLAMGLLAEILFGLWWDGGGISDLVIRDVGLFALAGALAIDPSRFWHLDNALIGPAEEAPRPRPQRALRDGVGAVAAAWIARMLAATALAAGVVGAGVVLYETGSGATVPDSSAFSLAAPPSASSTPRAQTSAPSATPASSGQASAPNATPASSSVQFSSWQFQQYSYQIYPGPANSDAQKALAGFNLSLQDQGNSVVVNLKALSSRYKDAQYTVAKGDTAYFVETSLRDDPTNQENNLNDDGVVVVDPQGYLLQG
jgi:hypothetical protein